MASLGNLLAMSGSGSTTPQASPREDYLMYAEACMTQGRQPLPFPDWVKAGQPAK